MVYGTLAEIFTQDRIQRDWVDPMLSYTIWSLSYNAIVGGSGDIGRCGTCKVNQTDWRWPTSVMHLCLGPVWEGISAAMDQFRELWEDDIGGLPVIINVMNNQYGMGGQTAGETMGYGIAARIGAGVNNDQMHAERVDGYNPLAVIDAYKRKRKVIEEKRGPVLLDVLTYRYSGHSPSDASSYRTKEEVEAWKHRIAFAVTAISCLKPGIYQGGARPSIG